MSKDFIWLTRSQWDTVWAAIHNIKLYCGSRVKSPDVTISGTGAMTQIILSIPSTNRSGGGETTAYAGPFKIAVDDKALYVYNGAYTTSDDRPCGIATVNGNDINVKKLQEGRPNGDVYIYLRYKKYIVPGDDDVDDELTESEVTALKTAIETLDGQMAAIKAEIDKANNAISVKNAQITDKNAKIAGKREQLSKLDPEKNADNVTTIEREISTIEREIEALEKEIDTQWDIVISKTGELNNKRSSWVEKEIELYGKVLTKTECDVFVSAKAMNENMEYAYYLLGSVTVKNQAYTVHQDHEGVLRWTLYGGTC